jgi:hypothetical protein
MLRGQYTRTSLRLGGPTNTLRELLPAIPKIIVNCGSILPWSQTALSVLGERASIPFRSEYITLQDSRL